MAATRSGFRPRPVDLSKQLVIVRDLSEIDTIDGVLPKELDPTSAAPHAAEIPPVPVVVAGPSGTQQHHLPQLKKPKPKEIPVPEVKDVPTYTRDYLPTFHIPDTYIRGKGGYGYASEEYVEYDLDNEDEEWLAAFNQPHTARLPDTKLERMLWRLELAWAEAAEHATGGPPERAPATVLGSTACLPKVQALNVLRKSVGGRDIILEQVYEYWTAKRKRWGKPMLRRLQPPTNPSDTNPYNVFRPREKANRPLTRRRRENSAECLEKLRQIRENMIRAMQLAKLTVLRERKKADLHLADMTAQRYQLNLQHQPEQYHAVIQQQARARLQELAARSALADQRVAAYVEVQQGVQPFTLLDMGVQRALASKRRRLEGDLLASLAVSGGDALHKLPPPVPVPEEEPLWAFQPDVLSLLPSEGGDAAGYTQAAAAAAAAGQMLAAVPETIADGLRDGTIQPYMGRGGRLVLARCNPLTLLALSPPSADGAPMANGLSAAPGAGTQENGMTDSELFAFHPPSLQPWAFAFDVSLLPDCVDRAPIVAARQHWLAVQEKLGRRMSGTFEVPDAGHEAAAAATAYTAAAQAAEAKLPSWLASNPPAPLPSQAGAAQGVVVKTEQPGAANGGYKRS